MKMSELTLNQVMIDYMTLTSNCDDWYKRVEETLDNLNSEWENATRMQYRGKLRRFNNGTCFLGSGEQEKGIHHILQVDGELCHDMRYHLFSYHPSYHVRCTRLDVQITVAEPAGWSQWDLLVRMRDKFGEGKVSYPKPAIQKGVLLQTVYVGRRAENERFLRVYAKLQDDGKKLLRMESELKEGRSRQVYKELCANQWDADYARILHPELMLQAQKDRGLHKVFANHIEGNHRPVRVQTAERDTATWIINTCIPSIDRLLNSHSLDGHTRGVIEGLVRQLNEGIDRWYG